LIAMPSAARRLSSMVAPVDLPDAVVRLDLVDAHHAVVLCNAAGLIQ
jgi:hypothetical protein